MEPATINPEESQAPVEVVSSVEKRSFKSGYVIAILAFLVFGLACGLTYFVLKDRGINLLSGIVKDAITTDGSKADDTSCDTSMGTKDCNVALDNSGWALFSVPEYKFSVEVPTYSPKLELGGEIVKYKWSYNYEISDDSMTALYPNYLKTVFVNFFPTKLPETVACGGFCVQQHQYTVNIFANKDGETLTQTADSFKPSWEKILNYDEMMSLEGSMTTHWNRSVWGYTQNFIESSLNGYLVVTKDYIYDVSYHISSTPTESSQIGQKVLDSMKFEE